MDSWRLVTRTGGYPRWVLAIANLLRDTFAGYGEIIGVPVRDPAPFFPLGVAGLFDTARNAGAGSLRRAGFTVDGKGGVRDAKGIGVCVALADARHLRQDNLIELRADGAPACDLAVAVERALRRGLGSVELEAICRRGNGSPRKLVWRCALKDHSIARSMDAAAARLLDLVGYVIRQPDQASDFPQSTLLSVPEVSAAFAAGASTLSRAFRHMVHRVTANDQWSFRVYQNLDPHQLWPSDEKHGIDFVPPIDKIWADPFVAREDQLLWVFFEEDSVVSPKGRIVCVSIDETGRCSEPEVVLEESCHLSYPQIFKCDDAWYMLPESGGRGNVVLYQAKNFPYEWEPVAELLTQVRLADATLHRNDAGWWLTASGPGQINAESVDDSPYDMRLYDTLHLYHSSSLNKNWRPVTMNPLRVDAASSRPAGPWFQWQGQWIRPVQDCRGRYGRAVHLLAVESISMQGLKERLVATLSGGGETNCVHTYSRGGRDLAVDWNAWRFKSDLLNSRKNPPLFEFERYDSLQD
jgi:hypothetical protein